MEPLTRDFEWPRAYIADTRALWDDLDALVPATLAEANRKVETEWEIITDALCDIQSMRDGDASCH